MLTMSVEHVVTAGLQLGWCETQQQGGEGPDAHLLPGAHRHAGYSTRGECAHASTSDIVGYESK